MSHRASLLLIGLTLIAASCSGDAATSESTADPVRETAPSTTIAAATSTVTEPPAEQVTEPETENLARSATITASLQHPDFPISAAVDGRADTWWTAGEGPRQWISLDLEAEATVTELRLTVSQDPAGHTEHSVTSGTRLLETITGDTSDSMVLTVVPPEPWTGITTLRIETTEGPSWVAWREIEVIGYVTGDPPVAAPDVIFSNGPILTMGPNGTAEALAITDGLISAVGLADEILATLGPLTEVIDLGGHALMPGFVDPHTHILNDAWRIGLDTLGGQQLALENGITTLANMYTGPDFLQEMRSYDQAGDIRARVSLYLIATDNCGEDQGDWWLEEPPTRNRGEMLRIGGIKLFLDGGTCGPWAVTQEIEAGTGLGELFVDTEEMIPIIEAATQMGHQVVIHSIGDRATLAALAAHAATTEPANPLRHRIDHMTMVTDEVIQRFGESGLVGAVFGFYPICTDFGLTQFFESNVRRHPELMAANPDSVIVWHGDDPWVGPVSPLQELHSMVTRVEIAEDGTECQPPGFLEDRTFEVGAALRMMTIDAAYSLHRDQEVDSLGVGKYADLIVLSADPTSVEKRDIYDIEVWMTMVGGKVEWCARPEVCLGAR